MEFDLKWVHMARYELILRLDGAIWLRIISEPLLTTKWRINVTPEMSKLVGVALGYSPKQ